MARKILKGKAVDKIVAWVKGRDQKEINKWASVEQTGVSLNQMVNLEGPFCRGDLIQSAQFLHRELPIRLARRIVAFDDLNYRLASNRCGLEVYKLFRKAFYQVREHPNIKCEEDEKEFTNMITKVHCKLNDAVRYMNLGVEEIKYDMPQSDFKRIDQFLDQLYMSGIGVTTLIRQQIALHIPPTLDVVGKIHKKTSPIEIAENACVEVRQSLSAKGIRAPQVIIQGDPDFTFTYIPWHLHMIISKLVYHSSQAVIQRYGFCSNVAPPLSINIFVGVEDVTIKISDRGPGMPRSQFSSLFSYRNGSNFPYAKMKLYARYFGGDLNVIPVENYGTDTYLHLSRSGDNEEPLP